MRCLSQTILGPVLLTSQISGRIAVPTKRLHRLPAVASPANTAQSSRSAMVMFSRAGLVSAVCVGLLFGMATASSAFNRSVDTDYVAEIPTGDPIARQSPSTLLVAQLSDTQRGEVQGIVRDYLDENPGFIRDYLLKNPEVISETMEALQRKQDEENRVAAIVAIEENRDLLFSSPRQVVVGNASGDVTLVEFFDYNCGYCRRAHSDMVRLIEDDPKLRIVLKEWPVLGDGSTEAAKVSIAVRIVAPERSEEFHTALISQVGQVNADVALAVAAELGLDRTSLEEAMKSEEAEATIAEAYRLAETLSLTGTPSYVTTEGVVVGAVGFEALKVEIARVRENCAADSTC